ncbi:hypothetical protein [Synergistes jonesii]|nr:hypothetical protein [Synergistes jonesii]
MLDIAFREDDCSAIAKNVDEIMNTLRKTGLTDAENLQRIQMRYEE